MSSNKSDKGKGKTRGLLRALKVSMFGGGTSSRDSVPSATTPDDTAAHSSPPTASTPPSLSVGVNVSKGNYMIY